MSSMVFEMKNTALLWELIILVLNGNTKIDTRMRVINTKLFLPLHICTVQ